MSDRQMGQGSRNCRREQYEEPKRIQKLESCLRRIGATDALCML